LDTELDSAINNALTSIPDCLAAGYVDMSTGMLLNFKTAFEHPHLDFIAAAAADLYRGKTVMEVERIWNNARGIQGKHGYFQDITVQSENHLHIFLRGKKFQDHVGVFVCNISANLGMALSLSRKAMPLIEQAF
jgi:hypothetical protein